MVLNLILRIRVTLMIVLMVSQSENFSFLKLLMFVWVFDEIETWVLVKLITVLIRLGVFMVAYGIEFDCYVKSLNQWYFVLQCRQKRMDIVGSCVTKKRDKACPIKFCPKCLLNRFDLMFFF